MTSVLYRAAEEARLAPSILNTQPWRWEVRGEVLELYCDPARQLEHLDPHGRLMILSCGAALHHARVALAAAGYEPVVERRPDPSQPGLLARIRDCRPRPAGRESLLAYDSIRRRRTDRRPFAGGVRVPAAEVARLAAVAEAEHVRLYPIERADIVYLRYAVRGADTVGAHDEGIADDLRRWTHRGAGTGDGVPPGTVVAPVLRPVGVRDFGLGGSAALEPGSGDDRSAEYVVLATDRDEPEDWLTAGEATSAVWLTAISEGLAVSPMSNVVEIPGARVLVRSLLHPPGEPQLVLRLGVAQGHEPPPASPRRTGPEVVDTE
jgi:nitroreductase